MRVHMKTRHFPTHRRRHIDHIHGVNALICVEMYQVALNMQETRHEKRAAENAEARKHKRCVKLGATHTQPR